MAIENKRIDSKRIVESSPIVLSSTNPELIWFNPKNVIVSDSKSGIDKYLGKSPFGIIGGGDGGGNIDGNLGDTVELTDIEAIEYVPYYTQTKELKFKAILKIRNSSDTPEEVIGVDARTANLEAQA